MKIVYKGKLHRSPVEFETEAFNDIEDESSVFEVDKIHDDIESGYYELPKSLQKLGIMMYTYTGDLTTTYKLKGFLKFNIRDFFRIDPNEIIDEDPEFIDSNLPIYIIYEYKNDMKIKSLIESYTKYLFRTFKNKYDSKIELIGESDGSNTSAGEEYLLNSWCRLGVSKRNYKLVEDVEKDYINKFNEHSEKYIPSYGPAKTMFGELLRACQRIRYRYFNDGDGCNWIFDGNIISYVNLAEMLYHWVDEGEGEKYKFFINKFKELDKYLYDPSDIRGVFYGQEDGDYAVMLVTRVEIALIETKEKFPDFMDYENRIDSRDYQSYW